MGAPGREQRGKSRGLSGSGLEQAGREVREEVLAGEGWSWWLESGRESCGIKTGVSQGKCKKQRCKQVSLERELTVWKQNLQSGRAGYMKSS